MKILFPGRRIFLVLTWSVFLAVGCAPMKPETVLETTCRPPVINGRSLATDTPDDIAVTIPSFVGTAAERSLPDVLPAGDLLSLTIEQAALMTLQNNRDLKVNQLNPALAGTFADIERGEFDPEWFAEWRYYKEKATETSRATGEQFGVKGTEVETVVGLRQKLPTGTTLEAAVSHERDKSNRAPDQQTARMGVTITQALLRGFGPAVNLAAIRQADLGVSASLYELRAYVEGLLADSEIAYWQYVLAEREIAIFESSLAVVKQQRDEIEQKIEVGLLPRTEAAAARAEVAVHEQSLIDARSLLAERRLRLLRKIGPGSADCFDLKIKALSDPFLPARPLGDPADRILLADQSRPDLNEARLRLLQNRLEIVVTANGVLPRLDFFVDLGRTGFADNFSQSFDQLDGNTYDYAAGVSLSGLIGNRAARARDYAARISYRQAAEAVTNLRQMIELEVRLAVNEVERAREQIAAGRATRQLEEEKLQAEIERFEVGAGTSLLVAQAQRDLLISRIAEVRSIIHYRIALVKLYLAEGSLLERRGVRVD